jgi:hypothetical protein
LFARVPVVNKQLEVAVDITMGSSISSGQLSALRDEVMEKLEKKTEVVTVQMLLQVYSI